MAVLIVGNVISGAVIAQYQRIGVLKSLGLTPAQVVAVYLSRIGWPALAGCLIGVIGGYLLSVPVLHQSAGRLRRRQPAGAPRGRWSSRPPACSPSPCSPRSARRCAPALSGRRGDRRRARAGARGRGYAVHRLAARLNLPRPVGLGLAAPFARPARTLVTLAAIAFGATAVIFAVGLHSSLTKAAGRPVPDRHRSRSRSSRTTRAPGRTRAPAAAQFAAAAAAISAQPGTAHSNAEYGTLGQRSSASRRTSTRPRSTGQAAWMGYALIAGHWYDAPGEVDVNTTFLTDSGLAVGDTATVYTGTVTAGARPVTVRIVGEVFQPVKQAAHPRGARRPCRASAVAG